MWKPSADCVAGRKQLKGVFEINFPRKKKTANLKNS